MYYLEKDNTIVKTKYESIGVDYRSILNHLGLRPKLGRSRKYRFKNK